MEQFLPALTQRLVDGEVRPSFQTRLSIALKGMGAVLKLVSLIPQTLKGLPTQQAKLFDLHFHSFKHSFGRSRRFRDVTFAIPTPTFWEQGSCQKSIA